MSFKVWNLLVDVYANAPQAPKNPDCQGPSKAPPPAPCPMPSITGNVVAVEALVAERELVRQQLRAALGSSVA